MAVFTPLSRDAVLERMIGRVVARTRLNDLNDGSVGKQLLAAVAREVEDLFFQTQNLLDLFDIDRAAGDDLDELAQIVEPDGVAPRRGAVRATGTLRFGRTGGAGIITIPQGTRATAGGTPDIVFETTATNTLGAGPSTVDIAARAVLTGVDGNVGGATITTFVSRVPGIDTVTNPDAFTGGEDEESDQDFRQRIKDHLRTLARSTVLALETVAKTIGVTDHLATAIGTPIQFLTDDTPILRRCVYAKAVEDVLNPGIVDIYIDDGSGAVAVAASTVTAVPEDLINPATGGERRFYTAFYPLHATAAIAVRLNAGALVEGVDFNINRSTGQLILVAALVAGDGLDISYTYHTDLIWAVQRAVEGDTRPVPPGMTSDTDVWPGWRAAGIVATVRRPTVQTIAVTANVTTSPGVALSDILAAIDLAISNYLNSLGIGNDVIRSQIIEEIMRVDGVFDVTVTIPAANTAIADNELVRAGVHTIS